MIREKVIGITILIGEPPPYIQSFLANWALNLRETTSHSHQPNGILDPMSTHPNPAGIFDAIVAHQRTSVLKAAIDLDLFTTIGAGATSVEAIAAQTKSTTRGIRILCDYLVTLNFLSKYESDYSLTPEAAFFLDRRSRAYMGSITDFLCSDTIYSGFRDIAATVRNGRTTLPGHGTMDPDHPVWVTFAKGMMPMMFPAAQAIAALLEHDHRPIHSVLDIAAGHGIFGIAIAQRFAQAHVTALDWQRVLDVASEHAAQFGVADRYRQLPGSAFEVDFGGPYDIVLVPNFYHHFDAATCTALAHKILNSLSPSGRMVTLEFVPDDDRINPPMAAQFAMVMLASTESGDAYTFSEFEAMFTKAGFSSNTLHDIPDMPSRIIVSER